MKFQYYLICILIGFSILFISCEDDDDDDEIKLFTISMDESIPADGKTESRIEVKIDDKQADKSITQISIETENGTFRSSSSESVDVTFNSDHIATAFLVSPTTISETVITGKITFNNRDYIKTKVIEFTRSLPDLIQVEADGYVLDSNDSDNKVILTIEAFKGFGEISEDTEIIWEAEVSDTTKQVLIDPQCKLDSSSDKCSVDLSNPYSYAGNVTVTAIVKMDPNISKSVNIDFQQ